VPRKNKANGSGVVLFKNGKILILIKDNGMLDIPKGHCDDLDLDRFSTAQRECFEETQIFITKSDLLCNSYYCDSGMTIFCAKTNQEPIIEKNPETGKLEHIDFFWIKPAVAIKILPDYLSNAVIWSLKHAINT